MDMLPYFLGRAAILDAVSGGGKQYTSIVYNTDNTVTLTDTDGIVHTMSCTYEGDKLIGVTYDGKNVALTYNGDALVKVGKTAVDVANANIVGIEPLDHTVTFTVDNAPYEVVSVKSGNSVNEPTTEPTKEGNLFQGWENADGVITFPIIPTGDVVVSAMFSSTLEAIYNHFNVDYAVYPYVVLYCQESNTSPSIYFLKTYSYSGSQFNYTGLRGDSPSGTYTGELSNTALLINAMLSADITLSSEKTDYFLMKSTAHFHANFEMNHTYYYPIS